MTTSRLILEVCVARVVDAVMAMEAGANRLEINSAIELDGLTPSLGLCAESLASVNIPIVAMLRPHPLGFVYDPCDRKVILRDAERLLDAGVHGIAFGALLESGDLDLDLIRIVRRLAEGRELVVHRAFDRVARQIEALSALIDLGVDRVLTSGGARSAVEGLPRLRALQEAAAGRIEILPAGGITHRNALEILQQTGCFQVHGTFKQAGQAYIVPDRESIAQTKQHLLNWISN